MKPFLAGVASMLIACSAATAGPVDDVRNADMINFTSIAINFTVTGAVDLMDSISEPNLMNCVPKTPGTLDVTVDLAELGAPFSAVVTLTATVEGDVIRWHGMTDVNQCVAVEFNEMSLNARVREVEVTLTAQAIAMAPSSDSACEETFTVQLASVADPKANSVAFRAFVECISLPFFEINFMSTSLMFTGESGAAPSADLNGDGVVNGSDLAILLTQWGTDGNADLTGDGVVNGSDLAALLTNWG